MKHETVTTVTRHGDYGGTKQWGRRMKAPNGGNLEIDSSLVRHCEMWKCWADNRHCRCQRHRWTRAVPAGRFEIAVYAKSFQQNIPLRKSMLQTAYQQHLINDSVNFPELSMRTASSFQNDRSHFTLIETSRNFSIERQSMNDKMHCGHQIRYSNESFVVLFWLRPYFSGLGSSIRRHDTTKKQ